MLGSISGEMPLGNRSSYCASKAAVHAFFRTIRLEEPTICISLMILDSFAGSNFRNNSLVKSADLENRNLLSVDEIAT